MLIKKIVKTKVCNVTKLNCIMAGGRGSMKLIFLLNVLSRVLTSQADYNNLCGSNPQANCTSITVAGESNLKSSTGNPNSFRASFTASRTAKNTLLANTKGGSPVALDDCIPCGSTH